MMAIQYTLVFLLLLSLVAVSLQESKKEGTDRGGIKVEVTQKGLEYFALRITDFLEKKIKGARLDDVAGTTETSVAYIDYWLKNIKMTGFTKPTATVNLDPLNGLNLSFKGAELNATSKWEYLYRSGLIKLRDDGSFDASAEDISMTVSVSVKKGMIGSPKPNVTECKCSIAKLPINLNSRANWFYNIILRHNYDTIKSYFENLFCKQAKASVDGMTSLYLDDFDMQVHFNDSNLVPIVSLNLALVDDPTFGQDTVSFGFVGRFAGDDIKELAPSEMKSPGSHMMGACLSDVTFNSAFRALHKNKRLYYSLDLADNLLVKALLRILEGTGYFAKGTGLTASIEPTSPPRVSIKPGNISISGEIEGKLIYKHTDGSNSTALSLKIAIRADLGIQITDTLVYGTIKDFEWNLTYMSITDARASILKLLVNEVTTILKLVLDEFLAQGYPIPEFSGFHLKDPLVSVNDRYVTVVSNIGQSG